MTANNVNDCFKNELYQSLWDKNYATRNPEERAGDIWYFSKTGDIYLIACGATHRNRFLFDEISWEHEDKLLEFTGENCHGMIALNYRNASDDDHGRCFLIPIGTYIDYQITCGYKTISMRNAAEIGTECTWADGAWNVPI